MRRRRFLASAALLGTTALAGCNDYGGTTQGPPTPTVPDGVTDWRFEHRQADDNEGVEKPPTVRCFPDEDRVVTSGKMPGGDDCSTLYPASVTRGDGAFRVLVDVHTYRQNCSDVLVIREYEAEVQFADGLPQEFTVVEQAMNEEGTRRTTKRCP